MSFSEDIKKEVLEITEARCCRQAQLCGVMKSLMKEYKSGIRINIADKSVAEYIIENCKKQFGLTPQRVSERTLAVDKVLYVKLCDTFGFRPIPENGVIDKDCCKNAFLRGVFLGCGKVNDPQKGYSLEFCFEDSKLREYIYLLLTEKGYEPKRAQRGKYYILYYRQSESIEDILMSVGAVKGAFELMNTKIEKQVKNDINRTNNCDLANFKKQANASLEQVKIVRELEKNGRLALLPAELKTVAYLRLNNPDMSLSEIGKLCDPPVSKSSIQRRFVKIQEYIKEPIS